MYCHMPINRERLNVKSQLTFYCINITHMQEYHECWLYYAIVDIVAIVWVNHEGDIVYDVS